MLLPADADSCSKNLPEKRDTNRNILSYTSVDSAPFRSTEDRKIRPIRDQQGNGHAFNILGNTRVDSANSKTNVGRSIPTSENQHRFKTTIVSGPGRTEIRQTRTTNHDNRTAFAHDETELKHEKFLFECRLVERKNLSLFKKCSIADEHKQIFRWSWNCWCPSRVKRKMRNSVFLFAYFLQSSRRGAAQTSFLASICAFLWACMKKGRKGKAVSISRLMFHVRFW